MPVEKNAENAATPANSPDALLWPIGEVIRQYPVSKSTFLNGVRAGVLPAPVRLSPKRVAWRSADIRALIASL